MKFTCDSCNAQYMISDDKVGPAGVKVRCKKCGHVILVRRVAEPSAAVDTKPSVAAPGAGPAPAANGATHPGEEAPGAAAAGGAPSGAPTGGAGLDAELGSAFDHAFGDTPPDTARPAPQEDLGATQAMGAEDAAKVFAPSAPAPTEWYVAIGQAQVGPLPLGEVKKKWEAGDVGPDSLVWRPGMGDWAPLTTVSELAGFLSPVPRASGAPAPRPGAEAPKPEPQAAPAAEVSWKPTGASALAALASEELASRAPEARPAPARPVKSLVDALPDGGGVDPTGALPIAIKGLETTGEKKIERRSSVARGAEKVRHRRSATRALVLGIGAGVLLVGGAAAAGVYLGWIGPARAPAAAPRQIASIPLPPPPVVTPAASPPPAAQPPVPAPPPAVAVAAQPAAAAPAPPAPEPKRAPEPKHAAAEPRPERRATTRRAEPPPREAAKPQKVAAAPAPDAKPAKKGGDSILDFDSGGSDSALDDALGGGSSPSGKRTVYVPPARAGGNTLPDKVSPGEINGAVAQRIDALRRCVSEQKSREPDATGTLRMRWVIQGDGSVRDVKCLTPEYAQGQFAACLGGVVKSIRFPRSGTTGQEVTFPFNF